MMWAFVVIGAISALLTLRRRRWIDAGLILLTALALAALVAPRAEPPVAAAAPGTALRAAQLDDRAPGLPIKAPDGAGLELVFPRELALGRTFELSMRGVQVAPGTRLQLLAENGQMLAQGEAQDGQVRVRWLPLLAEPLLLQARLLDKAGKVLAQGPIPVMVRAGAVLQVIGRLAAPSFDAQALNQLLVDSGAVLDWQVTLGKALVRNENASVAIETPDLHLLDAGYFEQLGEPARAALLAQVAKGGALILLGANARDPALWARTLALPLTPQDGERMADPVLKLAAAMAPARAVAGPWQAAPEGVLWKRDWQRGRIVWLGVSDWHRYAISEPKALGLWWQQILDLAGVHRSSSSEWFSPEPMPVALERTAVCLRGGTAGSSQQIGSEARIMLVRPDQADAVCSAVWPQQPGWLALEGGARLYVFGAQDWPAWQVSLQRAAALRYAARTPAALAPAPAAARWPEWPFGVLAAAFLLVLWWRERR